MFTSTWSDDEVAILRAHYPEHGARWVGWESLLPDRTDRAIQRKAGLLGITHANSERKKPKKRKKAPRLNALTHYETTVAAVTPDPYERPILGMMEAGMTPQQIDAKLHWPSGRTIQILTEMWQREERQ